MTVLIAAGAGMTGSLLACLLAGRGVDVVTLDSLSRPLRLENLGPVAASPRHRFFQGRIGAAGLTEPLLAEIRPGTLFLADTTALTGPDEEAGLRTALLAFRRHLPASQASAFRLACPAGGEQAWYRHPGTGPDFPVLPFRTPALLGPDLAGENQVARLVAGIMRGEPVRVCTSADCRRGWLAAGDHARFLAELVRHGEPRQTYRPLPLCHATCHEMALEACAALDRLLPARAPAAALLGAGQPCGLREEAGDGIPLPLPQTPVPEVVRRIVTGRDAASP